MEFSVHKQRHLHCTNDLFSFALGSEGNDKLMSVFRADLYVLKWIVLLLVARLRGIRVYNCHEECNCSVIYLFT